MSEFKKYDTAANYEAQFIRLSKDAEVKDFGDRKVVRVTWPDESRHEGDETMWVEGTLQDRQAALGAYLKKGDVVGCAPGKLTMRKYTDNSGGTRYALSIRRCELVIPPSLFAALKERGWTPGAGNEKGGAKKPAAKPAAKPAGKRPIVDLDDE